jgi:hypothetical protein
MLIEIYGTGESLAPNWNYGWICVEISARCLFIGIGGQDPFTFQVELPGLQDNQKLVPKSIYIQ